MAQRDVLLETGTNELEIIEFFVREKTSGTSTSHYFGVNVAKVLEVVEAPEGLEAAQAANPCYLGAIPLRELILPVIDLSVWLNMERDRVPNEPIVVMEFNNTITGFLVSGVTQIHRINWQDVAPPSKLVAHMPTNCINGTVQVDDRFVLMLDMERVLAELESVHPQGENPPEGEYSCHGCRALLADDSTSVREMLRRRFSGAGFDVELVNDGSAAWEKLQALKNLVQEKGTSVLEYLDVVISDIEMPLMDGYTLTRKIKEDPVLGKLPVVLFSSLVSDGLVYRGEAVNVDLQVTKPEFNNLVLKVVDLLRRSRR